jgi:DNA polymerase/3'-5' exonuclease PolX
MAREINKNKGQPKKDKQKNALFDLIGLMSITGIDFKKAVQLHLMLGINNMQDLYEACKEGRVRELKGFGEITEKKIKSEIELNILWFNSQRNKYKKIYNNDFQGPIADKDFLLNLAISQSKKDD